MDEADSDTVDEGVIVDEAEDRLKASPTDGKLKTGPVPDGPAAETDGLLAVSRVDTPRKPPVGCCDR